MPNDQDQQRRDARDDEADRWTEKTPEEFAVCWSGWILIIASPGMGRACPNGYTAQGPKALAWSWNFQKRVYASTTVRDQARRHPSGGSSIGGNET